MSSGSTRKVDQRNNTRDLMRELPAYCEKRGFVMPAEFLIEVMNGNDPRAGMDMDVDSMFEGGVTLRDSMTAALTLCKYLYATAQNVDVSGGIDVKVPNVVVTPRLLKSLETKLKEKIK